MKPKKPRISLSSAKKRAWRAFSLWVRLRDADKEGYVHCVTCGKKLHYKDAHASHFLPGRNNAVLFSEDGVHPSCYRCNIHLRGNWPAYLLYMKERYGQMRVDELLFERRMAVKYTAQDYLEIEQKYKEAQ